MKMKTILYCPALVALVVFTSAAFAQEPTLSSYGVKSRLRRCNLLNKH